MTLLPYHTDWCGTGDATCIHHYIEQSSDSFRYRELLTENGWIPAKPHVQVKRVLDELFQPWTLQGYTLLFISHSSTTPDGRLPAVLCHACAKRAFIENREAISISLFEEGTIEYCEECGTEIRPNAIFVELNSGPYSGQHIYLSSDEYDTYISTDTLPDWALTELKGARS